MITLYSVQGEKSVWHQHTNPRSTAEWVENVGKHLIWVRCQNPDEEALGFLSRFADIDRQHFQEILEEEERPHLSTANHLEIVYRVPTIEEGDVITTPFYIYINNNIIITIEKQKNAVTESLVAMLQQNKRKFLFKKNIGTFISYFLDKFNDDFLRYIDRISVRVDVFAEREVLSKENVQRIYDSSITLSYFNQALIANMEVLNELRKSYFRPFTQENRKQFAEVYYDMLQILDTEKIQREGIANLFNMQSVIASNRLNSFMKTVTLLAILVTVPAMISGIYGMNVDLPMQNHPFIFFILIGFMITLSLTLILAFKLVDRR